MEQVKTLNVVIVGGGPGCKAIMEMIFADKLSQLRMKLIGVACTNPEAVGYRYAQDKGVYTTRDYRDLYKLTDLNMIIELTGRDEAAHEISRTKPNNVRLMDHVSARLFWDVFQIEEQRITEGMQAEKALRDSIHRVQVAYDQAIIYAEELKQEITERKRAEGALRKSEERYHTMLEASPDPVVAYDMEGRCTYINPAFTRVFGWMPEELLGRKLDYVPEDNWPETEMIIDKVQAGESFGGVESRRYTKDGSILEVSISAATHLNREGIMLGSVHTLRDISARKRAEEALRAREVELEEQSHYLEEVNTALKVLLKQREQDKKEVEESIVSNMKTLVNSYLEELKGTRLDARQKTLVSVLESNLDNIVSPLVRKLSSKFSHLTAMEIRVANFVKVGKTNKEMAEILCLSENTILSHRYRLRSKLGLKNKKINLRSHLLSIEI